MMRHMTNWVTCPSMEVGAAAALGHTCAKAYCCYLFLDVLSLLGRKQSIMRQQTPGDWISAAGAHATL